MLFDHRTYKCKPGTIAQHLKIYEDHGFAVQRKHLGDPFAYMVTESGEMNTYVHIWAYKDAADRATKRAAMMADPGWHAYLKLSGEAGFLVEQTTKLMTDVKFMKLPEI